MVLVPIIIVEFVEVFKIYFCQKNPVFFPLGLKKSGNDFPGIGLGHDHSM